jgi:hypothetical protein
MMTVYTGVMDVTCLYVDTTVCNAGLELSYYCKNCRRLGFGLTAAGESEFKFLS